MKIFLVIWLGMLVLGIPTARACKCSIPTFQNALAWSDLVFVGTVIDVQIVGTPAVAVFNAQRAMVTFTTSVPYKGDVKDNMILYIAYGGGWCGGIPFEKGADYLVYARHRPAKEWLTKNDDGRMALPSRDAEIFTTSACWRTQQTATEQVKGDLRELALLAKRH